MSTTQKNALKIKQVAKLLNAEMKTRYPKNSVIVFSSSCNKGEKPLTASCGWYNKVGGKKVNVKNIVSSPPEWQNIPYEEAEKIAGMFDRNYFLDLVYV